MEEDANKDIKPKSRKSRKVRSPSFWEFGKKLAESNQFGQLVNLKTLDNASRKKQGDTEADVVEGHQRQSQSTLFVKPWVLNPGSPWRRAWDVVIVLASLIYTAIRVPYAIAFDLDEFAQLDVWFWFNRIVDAVFIGDMALIFMTGMLTVF